MKKLSTLSIADLVALKLHIENEIDIAFREHNSKVSERLQTFLPLIKEELYKHVSLIKEFQYL
jgi:hypothetical protein